jgi:cation transport ATPase
LAAVGFIAGNTPVSLYAPNLSILPKPLQDLFFGERNFALRNLGFEPYGEYEAEEYDRNGMEVVVPILAWLGIAFSLLLILVSRKQLRGVLKDKAVKLDFILIAAGVAGVAINSIAVPTEWFRENIYFFVLIYVSLIFLIGDLLKSFRNREAN